MPQWESHEPRSQVLFGRAADSVRLSFQVCGGCCGSIHSPFLGRGAQLCGLKGTQQSVFLSSLGIHGAKMSRHLMDVFAHRTSLVAGVECSARQERRGQLI